MAVYLRPPDVVEVIRGLRDGDYELSRRLRPDNDTITELVEDE